MWIKTNVPSEILSRQLQCKGQCICKSMILCVLSGVIQQLRGPNFRQVWSSTPPLEWTIVGILQTMYNTPFVHVTKRGLSTDSPTFSCPHSYWMTPDCSYSIKCIFFLLSFKVLASCFHSCSLVTFGNFTMPTLSSIWAMSKYYLYFLNILWLLWTLQNDFNHQIYRYFLWIKIFTN